MAIQPKYPTNAGIYKLTCSVNGKIYIGKAVNISSRMANHKYNGRKSIGRCFFENALIKYGWDSFNIEILEIFEDFDKNNDNHKLSIFQKEAEYIKL